MNYDVDFTGVEEVSNASAIPPGKYVARVQEVKEKESRSQVPYLQLRFIIAEGKYQGRSIFDSLFFTQKSKPRLMLALKSLGIKVDGKLSLDPSELVGRHAIIHTTVEPWETDNGEKREEAKIKYSGYESAPQDVVDRDLEPSEVPF